MGGKKGCNVYRSPFKSPGIFVTTKGLPDLVKNDTF